MIEKSNVLSEFMQRKDNGEILLDYYKKMNIDEVYLLPDKIEQGRQSAFITTIEFLLADPEILHRIPTGKQKELLNIAKRNLILKEKHADLFGSSAILSTLFVAAHQIIRIGALFTNAIEIYRCF